MIELGETHVRLQILAVSDHATIGDLSDQELDYGMVRAHHGKSIERHVFDECAKCLLHGIESLEVIEMLGIDVGHDRDVGRQLQERAVRFIGFDHHPVAGAEPCVRTVGVDDAAVDHGRVKAARIDERRNQRGGRRLAVRAGDRDAALEPHQLGQHLSAAHHRQALRPRRDELWIVALDGSRHHHHFGIAERGGRMADRNFSAFIAQPPDICGIGGIRPLHRIAEVDEHLGDAAHPDAADTDEVDRPDVARQFHCFFVLCLPAARPPTR